MKKLTGVIVTLSFFFLAVGTFNVYTVTTSYKGSFQEEIGVIRSHL